jgi:hypothetical protein
MRAIFGVLSLLVVLAIIGSVAKKQLQAINGSVTTRPRAVATDAPTDGDARTGDRDGATLAIPGGMPGAVAADPNGLTVPQQARNLQDQFRTDTARALQQGANRNARAEP